MQGLSERLRAVAFLAAAGRCVADVGTDHGYIPIYLLEQGKFQRAIAMDLREGPLCRARENRDHYGFRERMDLRRGDGLCALEPGEADTVVIAGMGGGLVIKILTEGKDVLEGVEKLVLQPQSEIGRVREFLQKSEYRIEAEHMVWEDGKFYPMMRAVHGHMDPLDDLERRYGPLLLRQKDPCLGRYLDWEKKMLLGIRENLRKKSGEKSAVRLGEVEEELWEIQRAKERLR